MKSLKEKLVKIDRFIQTIRLSDEKVISEITINLSLETLQKIINPPEFDKELYDNYELTTKQISEINSLIADKIIIQKKSCLYVLIAGGIYDWNKE